MMERDTVMNNLNRIKFANGTEEKITHHKYIDYTNIRALDSIDFFSDDYTESLIWVRTSSDRLFLYHQYKSCLSNISYAVFPPMFYDFYERKNNRWEITKEVDHIELENENEK